MLTKEQQQVVDIVCSNTTKDNQIIAVNAVAGSGKTSTAKAVIEAYKPKQGFYTAFNKAIVTDSNKKFGKLIEAKTIHALAYKYVKPSGKIEELNYSTIKEDISYEDKALVISILDNFFRSDSINIELYVQEKTTNECIQELVIKYADKMLNDEIPSTFNFMLKCLHIMLAHKEIQIDFDLFIFDEVQDVVPVSLEIFKLINAKRKLMLGDKHQNIYSFMNTVNAFNLLDNTIPLNLTKSFRCNEFVADIIDGYGKQYLDTSFSFKGNDSINKKNVFEIAYITRTNAMLIQRMHELLIENTSFTLTRNVNEIFALPIALLNASNGREVFDKKYKYLEKEYKNYLKVSDKFSNYFNYISFITEDSLLANVVKTLTTFNKKRINIYDLKKKVQALKANPNVILTTAHAFKGLEADHVYIEDDLNSSVNKTIQRIKELSIILPSEDKGNINKFLSIEQIEDLNTYYVALSRARVSITNSNIL